MGPITDGRTDMSESSTVFWRTVYFWPNLLIFFFTDAPSDSVYMICGVLIAMLLVGLIIVLLAVTIRYEFQNTYYNLVAGWIRVMGNTTRNECVSHILMLPPGPQQWAYAGPGEEAKFIFL